LYSPEWNCTYIDKESAALLGDGMAMTHTSICTLSIIR